MSKLPMMKFTPIVKKLVWGGRRLEQLLGKTLPADDPYGESWEVVDLPDNQSAVAEGVFRGQTLGDLLATHKEEILGRAQLLDGRFPLLYKFIDADQRLSVQVHPDEAACRRIGRGARPKTEGWYIIDCRPGAALYVGHKHGVDRDAFARALKKGEVEALLNKVEVSPGDFVYLPAGTVHAIGAGIVLAEVQQSSDTTYRVFDWNRVGLDGRPRQLHIEQALESIAFDRPGQPEVSPPSTKRSGIVAPYFELELVDSSNENQVRFQHDGPMVLMGLSGGGSARVTGPHGEEELEVGQTILIPASGAYEVTVALCKDFQVLATKVK